jgi:endogenous inhibitor of DNA gyrase (YacG/DUF329 family)
MIHASCPICGRKLRGQSLADWPQYPFCSPRCKTIDLGRWLNEAYRIPAAEQQADAAVAEDTDIP